MPVPEYIEIPDSDIDPESPINYSLLARLRDNILAVIGGGLNAPTMGPGLLGIGGGAADLPLEDSWAPTAPGYYDFDTNGPSVLSSPRTLPWFTFLRHRGDLTISATQTVAAMTNFEQAALFGLVPGPAGADATASPNGAGGGGNHGAGGGGSGGGGSGAGATARPLNTLNRWWLSKMLPLGGVGGIGQDSGFLGYSSPGGVLVLLVDGNLLMTGGTLTAPAPTNGTGGAGSAASTLIVVCTGTLTNGTFLAHGGNAGAATGSGVSGGGGAGGAIQLVANAYAGTQTLTATGGTGNVAGATGYTSAITLSAELIRGLIWR